MYYIIKDGSLTLGEDRYHVNGKDSMKLKKACYTMETKKKR